jgi:hypothetical protein
MTAHYRRALADGPDARARNRRDDVPMNWGRIGVGLAICAVGVVIAVAASPVAGAIVIGIGAFVVPAVGEYAARQQRR